MGLASNITVRIQTSDLTAEDGLDYIDFSSNLVFGAREVKKIIRVPIIDDGLAEYREGFRARLRHPSDGATFGDKDTAIVNIIDNDMGGVISFSRAEYVTNENAGFANITVTRTGGAASNVTVRFTTAPGSNNPAVVELDYTNVDTVLTF